MKKVALGFVLAALAVLAACSKSSDSGQNSQVCNAYGQCYNTAATTCGGLSGINNSPFIQVGANQCINRITNQPAPLQNCYATGSNTLNGTGISSTYCNQYGLNSNFSQFGYPSSGLCQGAMPMYDPTTGVTTCTPYSSYGVFTSGLNNFSNYNYSTYNYAPAYYPSYYGGGAYLYFGLGFHI